MARYMYLFCWCINSEVPQRFLSPEFQAADTKAAYETSQRFHNHCLYALHTEHVEINQVWVNYVRQHAAALKHFCYWNLAVFLHAKDPNVPDIPNKLIKLLIVSH